MKVTGSQPTRAANSITRTLKFFSHPALVWLDLYRSASWHVSLTLSSTCEGGFQAFRLASHNTPQHIRHTGPTKSRVASRRRLVRWPRLQKKSHPKTSPWKTVHTSRRLLVPSLPGLQGLRHQSQRRTHPTKMVLVHFRNRRLKEEGIIPCGPGIGLAGRIILKTVRS